MKNIIALFGVSNIGKSETIKLLYKKLITEYKDFSFYKDLEQIANEEGDIRIVIVINGKIIGIESQGDPNSRIFNSLSLFAKLNCDIIICATRTRGATSKAVENLGNEYKIEWIRKNKTENDFHSENNKMANLIFEKIKTLLTKIK